MLMCVYINVYMYIHVYNTYEVSVPVAHEFRRRSIFLSTQSYRNMHTYIHTHIYLCIYIYTYEYTYLRNHCACGASRRLPHVLPSQAISEYTYIHIYTYIYICVNRYIYMYVYICIHTYIYIHMNSIIYIYIYI